MKKEIKVCDYCGEEKELFSVTYHGQHEICARCDALWRDLIGRAIDEIQKRVNFSVTNRLALLDLLEHNDSIQYWGTEGVKWRAKIIEAFKTE